MKLTAWQALRFARWVQHYDEQGKPYTARMMKIMHEARPGGVVRDRIRPRIGKPS